MEFYNLGTSHQVRFNLSRIFVIHLRLNIFSKLIKIKTIVKTKVPKNKITENLFSNFELLIENDLKETNKK